MNRLGTLLRLYSHERPLFWTGLLGIALGGVCFMGMAFHGVIVEPEGNLYKAATFDIAVGIFLLTLALVMKNADFIPLIALLLGWARVPIAESRRAVHLAGLAWIAACLAIAWQTSSGRSVLEPSAATAIAAAVLCAWALILAKALLAFRRSGVRLDFLAA